jgi:hypothetical protein
MPVEVPDHAVRGLRLVEQRGEPRAVRMVPRLQARTHRARLERRIVHRHVREREATHEPHPAPAVVGGRERLGPGRREQRRIEVARVAIDVDVCPREARREQCDPRAGRARDQPVHMRIQVVRSAASGAAGWKSSGNSNPLCGESNTTATAGARAGRSSNTAPGGRGACHRAARAREARASERQSSTATTASTTPPTSATPAGPSET